MKYSVVLSTQPAGFQAATFQGELKSNLRRIAALGYDGVELAVRDPALLDLGHLQELVSSTGLAVAAIGTGQAWGEEGLSFTDPDPAIRRAAIDRLRLHLPLAARLQALVIVGLLRGVVKPGVDRDQAMKWLLEALQECVEAAQLQGVQLALEPINRYETSLVNNVTQGLELIERVGSDQLGLLLDTFHMNIEEPHLEDAIRLCGSRIFHIHVADSNRCYPGAGHLDFKSILQTLSEIGFSGWISGEFLPQPDADTAATMSINYLRAL